MYWIFARGQCNGNDILLAPSAMRWRPQEVLRRFSALVMMKQPIKGELPAPEVRFSNELFSSDKYSTVAGSLS